MNKNNINKNVIILLIGRWISLLGSQVQEFILSLYVLNTTGSATIFATVLSLSIIPKIIISPIIGVYIDKWNKKNTLIILDMLSGIICILFFVLTYTSSTLSLTYICILIILLSTISSIFQPTSNAIIPSIAFKNSYIRINSINSAISNIIFLVSPIFGGVIYALASMNTILIVNGISFLMSAFSECFINYTYTNTSLNQKSIKDNFLEGIRFICKNKSIISIISVSLLMNFLFSPIFTIGYPYILKKIISVSDTQFAFAEMVMALGMLLAPLILTKFLKGSKPQVVYYNCIKYISLILCFLSILVFQIAKVDINKYIYYIFLIAIGIISCIIVTIASILSNSMLQENVDHEFLGRVFTTFGMISNLLLPVGQIILGIFIDRINFSLILIICALFIYILYNKYKATIQL